MGLVKEKYKQTEIGLIPRDWEVKTIEELTPKGKKYCIVDGPFGSNLKTIHYRKSGIPIITSGYVTNGKFFAEDYLYVDLEKFKQEKRSAVNGGDIVMAKIGERCGASAILPLNHEQGILSGNALKITIDEEKYVTNLIWQILWNYHQKGDFETLKTTGAQPAISMANLKRFKIPLPLTKSEQTVITTALSDADALITALEKLIAKKRMIKQGAIQKCLNPDSYDFPDDHDYKNTGKSGQSNNLKNHSSDKWEVKKLGDCLKQNPDYGINAAAVPYNETLPTYLRITDITEDGKYSKKNVVSVDNIYASNYFLEKGDLVFARTGASVGKTYLYNVKDGKLVFAGFLIRIKTNPEILNPIFFQFYTQTYFYWNWIRINSMRTGQPGINGIEYKELLINIPPIEEQTCFATIFSDMDAEIAVLEKKLEKARMVKQGMMQQLLTGKIRLV